MKTRSRPPLAEPGNNAESQQPMRARAGEGVSTSRGFYRGAGADAGFPQHAALLLFLRVRRRWFGS